MKKLLLLLFLLGAAAAVALNLRYGEGAPYPDVTSSPTLSTESLETVLSYPEPVGNVVVSDDGRIFFTVHPESRPQGNRLLEWVDGAAEPWPDGRRQQELFDAVLGLSIDSRRRLWTIDHGNHGFGEARLLGFDVDSGELLHDHRFSPDMAPAGSMLQDLRLSSDGRWIFIADASIWRQSPAIVVYDTRNREARRVLESHPAVSPEDYVIRTPERSLSFLGGLVSLKAGVDGLALGPEDDWLYFAAINNSGLYRVPTADLTNARLRDGQLAKRVERVGDKPLSDGLTTDDAGNVYITDVEHGAVLRHSGAGLETLLRSPRIRWADSVDFGPDGWLYVADSAIPELILRSREHIRASGPYHVFRFRPPSSLQ